MWLEFVEALHRISILFHMVVWKCPRVIIFKESGQKSLIPCPQILRWYFDCIIFHQNSGTRDACFSFCISDNFKSNISLKNSKNYQFWGTKIEAVVDKWSLTHFFVLSEHFSFDANDCNFRQNNESTSFVQIRLSNRYENQSRIKICLQISGSNHGSDPDRHHHCLDSILVNYDDVVSGGTVIQDVSSLDVFNVHQSPNYFQKINLDSWIK